MAPILINRVSDALRVRPSGPSRRASISATMSPSEPEKEEVAEKQNARMSNHWGHIMKKEFGTPDRYLSIAVLIIHWDKDLDTDLHCEPEVNELSRLFTDRFRYKSRTVTLNTSKKPQNQLNAALAKFIEENDGPYRSHLLIVYYSGHGFTNIIDGVEQLCLSGFEKPTKVPGCDESYAPIVRWDQAEQGLIQADADVLTIMDCCYAAAIMKSMVVHGRVHELLAATSPDLTTEGPGPRSYTRALIDCLTKSLDDVGRRPFNTFDLNQKIEEKKGWSHRPHLYCRNHGTILRHIILVPLELAQLQQTSPEPKQVLGKSVGTLSLQVSFGNKSGLAEKEISNLAVALSKAAKEVELGITAIDWVGFEPARESPQFRRTVLVFRTLWLLRGVMCKRRLILDKRARALLNTSIDAMQRPGVQSGQRKREREEEEMETSVKRKINGSELLSPQHFAANRDPTQMLWTPSISSREATPPGCE